MRRITFTLATLLLAVSALYPQAEPPQPPKPPKPPKAPKVYVASASSYLGVGVAEVDADRVKTLKLKEERGVEVKSVDDESPAAKAGIKVNDVILEYNGQRVEGDEQFLRLVRETPVNRNVTLVVWRNGTTQTISATTGARPANSMVWNWNNEEVNGLREQMRNLRLPDMPHPLMSWQSRTLGVESESLTSQLAEYFGVKEGVLVRSVMKGTAAEKAGFRAGDVITRVGNQKVSTPKDITNALKSLPSTKTVPVTVMREKKEMTLNVTIEDKSSGEIRLNALMRVDL
jgi:serine protease Do